MTTERSQALLGLWKRVHEIFDHTEDSAHVRRLLGEARIEPAMHVGSDIPAEEWTDDMEAEWVLGQWAHMIDINSDYLNTWNNVSGRRLDRRLERVLNG